MLKNLSIFRSISISISLPILLGSALLAQTPEPSPAPEPTPTVTPVQKPRVTEGSQWKLCGRKQTASQRTSGFTGDTTGTYIREIQVNLHSTTYSTVTLNWANEDLSPETLPIQLNASPGAGNCELDCRSIPQSQQRRSHCTPLSPPTYLVQGYDCLLAKYPEAKFVTWFQAEREIAFHAYTVPPYPASHGCVRLLTKNHGAEWIYDNSLAGITKVKINWEKSAQELARRSTNPSPKCWSEDRLIDRPPKKTLRGYLKSID
jgi:L,D-transpeptidase catalytic domain